MHFYKSIYPIIFVLLFPLRISATDYYIDKDANGNNNGSSWNNAWESFSDIDWSQIQPGDVINISGGTTSKIYSCKNIIEYETSYRLHFYSVD